MRMTQFCFVHRAIGKVCSTPLTFTILQNAFHHTLCTSTSFETSRRTNASTFPRGSGHIRHPTPLESPRRWKTVSLLACSSRKGTARSRMERGLDCREDAQHFQPSTWQILGADIGAVGRNVVVVENHVSALEREQIFLTA
jgi:hypothetical protein